MGVSRSDSSDRRRSGQSTVKRMSLLGPGCVKTCMSRERAELFSPVSSFDGDWQSCSFPIQRNRDRISTGKFDVGVFTQPRSIASDWPRAGHFRSTPNNGHHQNQSACLKRADIVAKVENRTTQKISRKLIFGLLCGCVAL